MSPHLLYTITFAPPIFIIIFVFQGATIRENPKTILKTALFFTCYLTIFYQFPIPNKCWYYPEGQILKRFFGAMPIEDFALFSTISLIISSATLIFAKFEKANLPIIKSFFRTKTE